jgi:hypothetical protein
MSRSTVEVSDFGSGLRAQEKNPDAVDPETAPMPLRCSSRLFRRLTRLFGPSLLVAGALRAAPCGPFEDVSLDDPFCPAMLQMYSLGLSAGTSPTTFGPALPVTRQVLALILARGSTAAARGGSRRAALQQFWPLTGTDALAGMAGSDPFTCISDGEDVWVSLNSTGEVLRVHASDGALLGTWTGAIGPRGVLVAMGRVFAVGFTNPGRLYVLDPTQAPTSLTLLSAALGGGPSAVAFDGERIWTANPSSNTVSIVHPSGAPVVNVGGFNNPVGILYDGSNIWLANTGANALLRLDASGSVLDTVPTGGFPNRPVFDGTNVWVPLYGDNAVAVVNAASRAVVATLTGNGLANPGFAAFDGERVLVTNAGGSVSVWRVADFAPLGTVSMGASSIPLGACSDGVSFWIALIGGDRVVRF